MDVPVDFCGFMHERSTRQLRLRITCARLDMFRWPMAGAIVRCSRACSILDNESAEPTDDATSICLGLWGVGVWHRHLHLQLRSEYRQMGS